MNKEKYLIPLSIVIAGVLVALAVILSPVIWKDKNQIKENSQTQTESQKQWEELVKNFRLPDKTDWIRGDLNQAQVIFVEYSDLECPFCKRFHQTMKKAIEKYGPKIAWVYRHFPIETLHSKAMSESIAAECVGLLGGNQAFWQYIDKIFEITPSNDGLDLNLLPQLAKEIGIDLNKFNDCYTKKQTQEKIKTQIKEAVEIGVRGTPFTLILFGDQKIPLPGHVEFEILDNNFLSKVIQ